jgi:phospholipase/carboxylesterase
MNRIQTLSPADVLPSVPAADSAAFRPTSGGLACAVFVPLHYERNYAYPLLVWLHGPEDDENQLKRIMPLVSMRNYVAVAPRGPARVARTGGRAMYTWRHHDADLALAEQRVFDSIAQAESKFHIHPRRVFIAGFDVGGTMALRLALTQPDCFAGVLSLGGMLPSGRTLGRLHEARRVPLFLACGRESTRYPTDQVCADLRLLHSAGMDITLRQYPGGQQISPLMLADMDRWMMELTTGTASPSHLSQVRHSLDLDSPD